MASHQLKSVIEKKVQAIDSRLYCMHDAGNVAILLPGIRDIPVRVSTISELGWKHNKQACVDYVEKVMEEYAMGIRC